VKNSITTTTTIIITIKIITTTMKHISPMHSSFLYPFLILQILNSDFIIPNLNIFLFLSFVAA